MRKVLVTGDFEIGENAFPSGFELVHIRCPVDEQQILNVLPDVQDYILGGPEFLSARLIDVATRLENVVVMGTGIASFVDIEHATKKGIRLANTPHMNFQAVTEFTLAMITVCLAKVFQSVESVKEGTQWIQAPRPSLSNLNIGFVGMGTIGSEMARNLHLRGCRSLYYWSRRRKVNLEASLGLRYSSLEDIVKTADVLCIHITGCPETRHLINGIVLKNASPTLSIFNLSSPKIICPAALKDYLQSNKAAFCFIDGYYNEWVENKGQHHDPHGLLSLPPQSLVVTSHLAAQEQEVINNIFARAAALIREFTLDEIKP